MSILLTTDNVKASTALIHKEFKAGKPSLSKIRDAFARGLEQKSYSNLCNALNAIPVKQTEPESPLLPQSISLFMVFTSFHHGSHTNFAVQTIDEVKSIIDDALCDEDDCEDDFPYENLTDSESLDLWHEFDNGTWMTIQKRNVSLGAKKEEIKPVDKFHDVSLVTAWNSETMLFIDGMFITSTYPGTDMEQSYDSVKAQAENHANILGVGLNDIDCDLPFDEFWEYGDIEELYLSHGIINISFEDSERYKMAKSRAIGNEFCTIEESDFKKALELNHEINGVLKDEMKYITSEDLLPRLYDFIVTEESDPVFDCVQGLVTNENSFASAREIRKSLSETFYKELSR